MNIQGVTQTAQVLPMHPTPEPQASAFETLVSGVDTIAFSAEVQTQVMDMAQTQFEQAANELISMMQDVVGSSVDMSV